MVLLPSRAARDAMQAGAVFRRCARFDGNDNQKGVRSMIRAFAAVVFVLSVCSAAAAPPVKTIDMSPNPRSMQPVGGLVPAVLPDLTVSALDLSPPGIKAGEVMRFTATVKNIGNAASPASGVSFIFAPMGYGYFDIPPLQPGQSVQRSMEYTFVVAGGAMTVTATVDQKNAVKETNETNNSLQAMFNVQCRPELAAYDILHPYTELTVFGHPNQDTTIVVPVKNFGCAAAPSFSVSLSCPGMFPAAQQVPGLAPNQAVDVRTTYRFPETKAYVCTFNVDIGNSVDEAFEQNNYRTVRVNVAPAWPKN
jgi:subtilase family serine protease